MATRVGLSARNRAAEAAVLTLKYLDGEGDLATIIQTTGCPLSLLSKEIQSRFARLKSKNAQLEAELAGFRALKKLAAECFRG